MMVRTFICSVTIKTSLLPPYIHVAQGRYSWKHLRLEKEGRDCICSD